MHPDHRRALAEKIAGEVTISDNPGIALKRWRLNFHISQVDLAVRLPISASAVSDYESGRRKSPGTNFVKRVIETLLLMDEEKGGIYSATYASFLKQGPNEEPIVDMFEFGSPVPLGMIVEMLDAHMIVGESNSVVYGYTIVDSLKAILKLPSYEFQRIYGWSAERVLIFTNVSNGKSPMVAIRVTPIKPRCVVLHGIHISEVHPLVPMMAETDHVTVLCTTKPVNEIIANMRHEK